VYPWIAVWVSTVTAPPSAVLARVKSEDAEARLVSMLTDMSKFDRTSVVTPSV
jgi:hypothetical protein